MIHPFWQVLTSYGFVLLVCVLTIAAVGFIRVRIDRRQRAKRMARELTPSEQAARYRALSADAVDAARNRGQV